MKYEIWLLRGEFVAGASYLSYADDAISPDDILDCDAGSAATAEALASLCDRAAEDCNAHEFCGTHRLLGALLCRRHGRVEATKTLLFIAERGGLHRMSGVGCDEDAFEELGVGECGKDWEGSFGP